MVPTRTNEITAWVFARLLGGEARDTGTGSPWAHEAAIIAQGESTLAAQDSACVPATRPTLPLDEYVGSYADPLRAGHARGRARAGTGGSCCTLARPAPSPANMEHCN